MARSEDIQNDINHLQARWDDENRAAQNIDAQIRHLQEQARYHMSHMADIQSQIQAKQRDLDTARNMEAREQRDQAAALKLKAA